MAVKKLLIKKKGNKLVIHKKGVNKKETPVEDETTEPEVVDCGAKTGTNVVANVSVKEGGKEEVNTVEQVADFVGKDNHRANVGFSVGRTINMGNYEALKIQVSINVPSIVSEEEIEGNYTFAKDWVESKMIEIIADYNPE